MANLSRETKNGKTYFRVQFYNKDRARKSIRLGTITPRDAERIRSKIADLVSATVAGASPDREVMLWISRLGQDMADKLAEAGLIAKRESSTLAAFIDGYIASRTDAKPNTIRNYKNSRGKLVQYFGEECGLRDITPGRCDEWRQSMVQSGLSPSTISKAVKHAKHFFQLAQRKGLIDGNPCSDLRAAGERNDARLQFVDQATIAKVLDAAEHDPEWQLVIALARFGGLRTPSETLALKWSDIDWEHNRFTVHSPKTEKNGKAYRVVPIFPELRPYLERARQSAAEGAVHCVGRYRESDANLRSRLLRTVKKAGVSVWPRLYHNLRASRQTELTDTFPSHVVARWIGNSPGVAERHYLKDHEEHFERAAGGATGGAVVAQKSVPHGVASKGTVSQETRKPPTESEVMRFTATACELLQNTLVPPRGVEPLLPD